MNEEQALRKAIEKWITKNIGLVQQAQILSKKILDYGLLESEKTMPFQILPTTFFDSDGDAICKLYVHMEHPMYGFFSIEMLPEEVVVTCSNVYYTDFIKFTLEECHQWVDTLNQEMDGFYNLYHMAENKDENFCNLFLNDLLTGYNNSLNKILPEIKEYIEKDECTAIEVGNTFALAKDAKKSYEKALLIPSAWFVFTSIDNLPDPGEKIDDYIDEEKTKKLFEKLNNFFRQENYFAAPIYLAQRICLQNNMKVEGYSTTEESLQEAISNTEHGEAVLNAIDMQYFKVSKK